MLKYINLCCDEDCVLSVESKMVDWVEGMFVKGVVKCESENDSIGWEIEGKEGLVKSLNEMKEKVLMVGEGIGDYDGGEEEWNEKVGEFKDEVEKLGGGGKWFVWGIEYDMNISYVVE